MIKMFSQMFKDANSLFPPLVKRSLWLLLILFIGVEFLHHYFLLVTQLTKDIQSMNIYGLLGQLFTSLLEFVTLTMLIPLRVMELDNAQSPGSFWAFTQKHIGPLTIESMRALAMTILWSLLFIVPGVIKYIRYFFVPYVVVADPLYQKGERDALEYSNQLVKGITFALFVFLVLLLGVDITRNSLREQYPLLTNPIPAFAFAALFFAMNVYANILLFRLYQLRAAPLSGGTQNGTHV